MANGFFSGNPKTEWLVNASGADRDMKLIEDFSYTDPKGKVWVAPKGSVINGASIPRPLWSTVGSPYTDDYRRASIVHDVACDKAKNNAAARKEADVMFYYACLAGGCSVSQANLLYAGVRVGAWTTNTFPINAFATEKLLFRSPLIFPHLNEAFLQNKFQAIASDLEKLNDAVSIEDLDNIIKEHIKI